jgi:hypothetical protein
LAWAFPEGFKKCGGSRAKEVGTITNAEGILIKDQSFLIQWPISAGRAVTGTIAAASNVKTAWGGLLATHKI